MDPRKQKRLGPAPIASFEKSFEDNTTTITTATTTTRAQTIGGGSFVQSSSTNSTATAKNVAAVTKDINRNGEEMESHGSNIGTKTTTSTTTTTSTATTTTTTKSRDGTLRKQQQIQQQQPINISVSVSSSESTKSIQDGGGGNSTTTTTTTTTKRPPPLKATIAAGTKTTTLVSSAEEKVLMSYKGTATLTTPSTPRIELSRASSSSHHEEDSRESSPDNVFEQVGTGTLQEAIGLGFREEGALELRSSTEELYFMDPETKKEEQEKMQQQQQAKRSSPQIFKFDEHQSYLQQHQRKDSASSEVAALLCISGRTSRISSVGSQGSAVSRLSAVSGVSRSPSPHRMLLETSFCGPKPLENLVDGHASTTAEPATAELLEQVLLARKHDPTQVVLAEGIKVQSSPKKKPPTSLSNGDAKLQAKIATQNRPSTGATAKSATMGAQRRSNKSPGQMVIGKTPSGTEYIRINLKPDHMYEDKGIGPNERVVEAPNSLAPVYARSQKKPVSLSLGRNTMDENRLTPTASPKPTRHSALSKDSHGSRSPSPANISVSRKSSFSSIFRLGGKDSPDSPRERSRSRSKSKERGQTPQSQNVTPSKQKSVLAIFKPGKRGSSAGTDTKSSKSSSPIDVHELLLQQPPHQQHQRSKNNTPLLTATGSRPASRLRYYDEPVEGYIHIPLHTPPEEKEARKLLQGIQQLNAEPVRPASAPITAGQLAAAAAALKPVGTRKDSGAGIVAAPLRTQPQQSERLQRIENLDAIQTLSQDDDNKEGNWSMEVNRHSSQDSQESRGSDGSYASAIKVSVRSNLANVKENEVQENGTAAEAEIHRLPSVDSACESKTVETVATVNVNIPQQMQQESASAKEKRRILFATRLGSGSQEQIFSTQFSISKTESQSSQLSEQVQETIVESPVSECLQRQDTVIRRPEDETDGAAISAATAASAKEPLKRLSSIETTAAQRQKSVSTSEDEKPMVHTTVAAVVLRRKESNDELRRKSRSTSEEDVEAGGIASQRHSRYLENFDVRKKYHENLPRKPKRQSISETNRSAAPEEGPEVPTVVTVQQLRKPTLPQPPPPSTTPSPSPTPTAAPSDIGSRSPTPPTKSTAAQLPRSQSQSPVDRSRQTPTKPPRTTTPTRRTQTTPPSPSPTTTATVTPQPIKKKHPPQSDRQSANSTDEPVESSESERDSDLVAGGGSSAAIDPKRRHLPRHVGVIEDHESTGLVSQESFDDELPYVPTTLPEERAQGIPLIPMKERSNMELKTCPVDRPRSTTPLNPSHLEEYCGIVTPQEQTATYELCGPPPVRSEKLRISLPRKDSTKDKVQSSKSPRRTSNASGKSWFEFAEEGIRAAATNLERKDSNKQLLQQPQQQQGEPEAPKDKQQQKPPKTSKIPQTSKALHSTSTVKTAHTTSTSSGGSTTTSTSTQRKLSGHWIDFENIPEKRKPPKRITTLPKDGGMSSVAIGNGGSRAQQHATATFPTTAHHHHHGHHHTQPDVTASTANTDGSKLHYNYVKPEDCQCECHEVQRGDVPGATCSATTAAATVGTGAGKALTTVDLLQQGEDMLPLLDPDTQEGIDPSDSSREYSCYTDDEMDVPMRHGGSSRSKSSSSKLDEFPRRDVSHSPRAKKFPDNRK